MGVIAAIHTKSGSAMPELVRRMLGTVRHYEGDCAISVRGSCALGALSSSAIADSFLSTDGDWSCAFTGKLDNTADVAALVVSRGGKPPGSSPADLVVASLKALGDDAPRHLRGVFAAIVTNGTDLWCFRDHLGWRPLHFHDRPDRFVVASEAKQVVVGAELTREPNLEVLEALFYSRLGNTTPAALAGIDRLPQATLLHVHPTGRSSQGRYWHPARLLESSRVPVNEVRDQFVDVFGTAVRRSLTGEDVVSLSGGVDSPAVAGFAAPVFREITHRPLPALSTVYPNHPKVDESRYIQLVAERLGMELRTFVPTAGPWDNLEHWVSVLDGPTPTLSLDEITEYYQLAHRLGHRNVLGGDIAEAVINLNRHVIGHLFTRGRWNALAAMGRNVRAQGTTWTQFGKFMLSPFIPGRIANWYVHRTGRDYPQRIPNWLSATKVNEVPFRKDLLRRGRDRWSGIQLLPFEGTTLTLEAGEVAAHLSGVTTRSPFADVDVIEFFLGLPAEVKFPDFGSKTLVRRMLRGRVPDEILDRKDKTVFSDYMMSHLNYDALRRYVVNPSTRIDGVDYAKLAERVERQDFTLIDYVWANDLVRVHAFLSQW